MNRQLKITALLLILVVSGAVYFSAHSQSGRRKPTPPPAAPIPTPTPEPTPEPKNEPKSNLEFVVGIDRSETFVYYPLNFYTAVLNGCSARLSRVAKVSTSNNMNRAEAVKKAKAEKTAYVVWLRLTSFDTFESSRISHEDVEIEFALFTPGTGKIVTSGKSYQNAARAGGVVVQPPPGSSSGNIYYREHLLKRAAEDAADRVLKALHISSTND